MNKALVNALAQIRSTELPLVQFEATLSEHDAVGRELSMKNMFLDDLAKTKGDREALVPRCLHLIASCKAMKWHGEKIAHLHDAAEYVSFVTRLSKDSTRSGCDMDCGTTFFLVEARWRLPLVINCSYDISYSVQSQSPLDTGAKGGKQKQSCKSVPLLASTASKVPHTEFELRVPNWHLIETSKRLLSDSMLSTVSREPAKHPCAMQMLGRTHHAPGVDLCNKKQRWLAVQ